MRILYDTNVLVTILSRREAVLMFKKQLTERRIIHITSQYILGEVEAVLVEILQLTRQKAKAATRLIKRQSVVVYPKAIDKVSRDPFDDYILAAAVAGKTDYIITADKDLLVLKRYKNVSIVTVAKFEKIVGKSPK